MMVFYDMIKPESAFPKDPSAHRSYTITTTPLRLDIKALNEPMPQSTNYSTGLE